MRLDPLGDFREVHFLIDTGADFSALHPEDAVYIWPEYRRHDFLSDPSRLDMSGIGGSAQFIRREVDLQFWDDQLGGITGSSTILIAAPHHRELWELPSLLGRDILEQFTLTMSGRARTVTLEL